MKDYLVVSTKLDSDVIEFLKLLKKRYGVRTMSEGARQFCQEHDPETLKKAQSVAEIRASIQSKGI